MNNSDETEGRRLYRARAEAEARLSICIAGRFRNARLLPSPADEPRPELFPPRLDIGRRMWTRCQSDDDGYCDFKDCPQLRDNEPHATGRHCPLDKDPNEDGELEPG